MPAGQSIFLGHHPPTGTPLGSDQGRWVGRRFHVSAKVGRTPRANTRELTQAEQVAASSIARPECHALRKRLEAAENWTAPSFSMGGPGVRTRNTDYTAGHLLSRMGQVF
jgi:hypothetical protein